MADKNKLKKISGELKKASKMHAAQAKKIDSMSKGPSMMMPNITGNMANNFKVQELGSNLFQGEEMANQFAQKQMDKPVPPPGDGIQQQYMQPFSQKKIVKNPVPQPPLIEPERVPKVAIKKIPEKPRRTGYERIVNREMPSLRHEIKKPRMVPEKAIKTIINMNGDPKGRPYVVNKEKRGTSRDTLFLPKDAYVSENNYFDDEEIRKATKEAVAKGTYNLPKNNDMYHFSHLEDSGEAKYKKNK